AQVLVEEDHIAHMLILHCVHDGLVVSHVEALETEHEHLPDLDLERCVRNCQGWVKGMIHGWFPPVAERDAVELGEVLRDERRAERAGTTGQGGGSCAERGLAQKGASR